VSSLSPAFSFLADLLWQEKHRLDSSGRITFSKCSNWATAGFPAALSAAERSVDTSSNTTGNSNGIRFMVPAIIGSPSADNTDLALIPHANNARIKG